MVIWWKSFLAVLFVITSVQAAVGENTQQTVYTVKLTETNKDAVVTVSLVSGGVDGLFLTLDGKTVGRATIVSDHKSTFRSYLADWDLGSFQFNLTHRTTTQSDGNRLWGSARDWRLEHRGKEYTGDETSAVVFPQADDQARGERRVLVYTEFSFKPGGLNMGELAHQLYPLSIEPYMANETITTRTDQITGSPVFVGRFYIDSTIETEHVRALIRGPLITLRHDVVSDVENP